MGTNQNSRTHKLSQATDNTINNSFRLIAIRPYADSSKETLKALHPDTTYFLVGDYIDKYKDGKWVDIEKSSEVGPLPHDFFSVKVLDENKQPLEMPFVNISAIVGKNGCGKSSLVEFLIQLINNVAIKEKFSPSQDSEYAEGTYGRVYYETDNHIYYIDCSFSEQEDDKMIIDYSDKSKKGEINKDNFFYSIISNYSLYAYNCNDYDKSWFANLFHKNDSYQMPIVITPMRDRGNIDINAENYLAKLRLLSIFTQAENSLGRKISDKKYTEGIVMSLNCSSKLINYINQKFYIDNSRHTPFKTKIYELAFINKKNVNMNDFDPEIRFWTRFDKKFWTKYRYLINHANSIAQELLDDDTNNGEIYNYINLLQENLEQINLNSRTKVKESIETLKEHCQFLNAIQFQRLMIIIYVCELWDKKKIFSKRALFLAFSKLDKEHECTESKVQAYLYVIYKTITIFETYYPYNKMLDFDLKEFVLFDGEYKKNTSIFNRLDECFDKLFDDNGKIKVNYKSLKLRQTLNFLTVKNLDMEYRSLSKKSAIFGMSYHFTFDKLHWIIEKYRNKVDDENLSLLPPPIFLTQILVQEDSSTFLLSNMSSGELQMLYSVGALIYHLRNLDYKVSNDDFIKYNYVSIILEEVEQYFHPEYQQDYVHTLLTYIANACFKNIKGINIVLVTHSPFVLSDIPKQNVLFLKEGIPTYSMQQNTFGANIHSMLKNGFFLNGLPIGGFAKEKINELTKTLHNGKDVVDNKGKDKDILKIINLIGEPVVKSQLLKMYSDYKMPYIYENKIKELEAKIEKLENEHDKD